MMSPALHVVLIDPSVPVPDDAGPDRFGALTRGIASAGHHVTVLAGQTLAAAPSPVSAVDVRRVLAPLARRFGVPAVARPGRGYGASLLRRLSGVRGGDVVMLRLPPVKGALAVALYCKWSGVPLVLDAREIQGPMRAQSMLSRLVDRLRLWSLRRTARHVFAATPDIKSWFEAAGFDAARVSVAPDGADTGENGTAEAADAILRKLPQLLRGPLVVYAGGLNRGRRLAEILEMAAALQPLAPNVSILLLGDGPDRLDLNAYAARLDVLEKNVWFVPAQSRAIARGMLAAATVVLSLPPRLHEGGLEAGSHLFDGLAAGKPIAVLGDGWQKELVEGRQAGVALPAGDAAAAARELADFLRDGELVRRAGEQAGALARGKQNVSRIVVEMRQTLERVAAAHSRQQVMLRRYHAAKRLFDLVFAAVGIIVLSPLMAAIALVLLASGWTPIAGRERGGRRGRAFRLLTFDTTRADHDRGPGPSATWSQRFAHGLRRSALDRLPELWNVLVGDMSIVGPRPLPSEYTTFYTDNQLRRLDVRPGLTGWAQVNGRDGLSWEQMFAHDLWYVDHRGVGLDAKILWRTVLGLFSGRTAAPLPSGQLPRFDEIEARRQGAEDV